MNDADKSNGADVEQPPSSTNGTTPPEKPIAIDLPLEDGDANAQPL